MATLVRSEWMQKLCAAVSAVVGVAVIVYVMATGVSILADLIAPGVWGYLGVVGFIALIGPLPFLLLNKSIRLFGRSGGLLMLVGALTIAVASVGGDRQWPAWAAALWLAAAPLGYLAVRAILSMPAHLTHRRAAKLLRRHRAVGKGNAWSLTDWEWAYTQLGTPIALNQAAWCRMLQKCAPSDAGPGTNLSP